MTLQASGRVYRFGLYEAHAASGDLFRQGRRIKLQEQPFRLLIALLENPGEIVTRETLRQRLWQGGTFVEFDQSLATAVTKLRQALSDTADNPRFVETVPKRGYRFLAPVTIVDESRPSALEQIVAPGRGTTYPTVTPDRKSLPSRANRMLRYALVAGLAIVVLVGFIGTYVYYQKRKSFLLTQKDTILVADFVNATGEPVFDDALRQGLEIGLQQSPVMNLLPDRKMGTILKEMGRASDDRVSGKVAVEACQRGGSKVAVQGSISSLGTAYLIGLAAIRCDSGEPIALEQVQASRKEDVVDALGRATTQLRTRLGESLPSIQKFDVPLEQATTPSLEALEAYNLGLSTWDHKGDEAAIPFFKTAIKLDPNFAMAYGALATVYHNLSETELARSNASRAYELRDRVTESEKIVIESRYTLYVTGDLEKAAQIYEFAVQNYPNSAGAWNHLGTTNAELGRYQNAIENLREALRIDPTRATTYANLTINLLALSRIDEAGTVLDEANRREMTTDFLLQVNYWRAFLHGDREEMQRIVKRAESVPGARSLLLSEQANTEAYYGHFERARQLSQSAADLMKSEGDKDQAADCLAEAAIREAEIGDVKQAREFIVQAKQSSNDQSVVARTALAMATLGDSEQATSISDKLNKEYPSATIIQKYWLPTIRAEVALHRGKAGDALRVLEVAVPYESVGLGGLSVSTLHPAYVRGEAYLALGDANKAAAEFQKLIDNPGLVLNMPLAALARLGRARAYSHLSDTEKTRAAYQDFLQVWKDADVNVRVLRQAHSEFQHCFPLNPHGAQPL